MAARVKADEIRKCIDRGLARYGRGELQEAITEWERALSIDPENPEATTLIEFVTRNLSGERDAQGERAERTTDKSIPTFPDDWTGGFDTSPGNVHDAATRIAPDVHNSPTRISSPEESFENLHRRNATIESPIPQLLAQITAPGWRPPPDREEGAPDEPVWEEHTRRIGSERHPITSARNAIPSTFEMRLMDPSADVRQRVAEMIDVCRDLLWNGDVQGAVAAAEMALREGEHAAEPGVADLIDPARRLFEKTFEAYIGGNAGIPVFSLSPEALAAQELDHRAGFILSQIDGAMTVEHLLDVASMPRFDALRILAGLLKAHAIRLL